jgi:hypothetical protein
LGKVKTKVALNLTKRQLICFGAAALIGVPTYLLTRGALGNSAEALVMIGVMLPCFFLAMYEKDGQPAEKLIAHIIRSRFLWPRTRPYKTENFYESIAKEGKFLAGKDKAAAGQAFGKRPAGKGK